MKPILIILYSLLFSGVFVFGEEKVFWKSVNPQFDSLTRQMEGLAATGMDDTVTAQGVLDEMYRMSESSKNGIMRARSMFWDVRNRKPANLEESIRITDKALAQTDSVEFRYDYSRIQVLKAGLLLNVGDYYGAFLLYNKAIPYFGSIGDLAQLAVCNGNMGLIYLFMEDYGEALRYLTAAREWFRQNGQTDKFLLTEQQIAYIYEKTGKKQEAKSLLQKIITDFPESGRKDTEFYFLSSYFRLLADPAEKERCMNRMMKTAFETDDWQCQISALKNKAAWLYEKNETDSALWYAKKVYQASRKNVLKFGQQEDVYDLLARIYEKKGLWKKAYEFKVLSDDFRDSVRGAQVQTNIQKEKIRQEIVRQDFLLRELNLEKTQLARLAWIVGISLILVTALSVMVIRLLRKRLSVEKVLRERDKEELTAKIDHEKTIAETKSRELSGRTLLAAAKNKVLSELSAYVEHESGVDRLDKKIAGHIKGQLQDILKEDKNWEQFKLHFEEVHPSFFKKLKERHPKLTENDLRLCAYCKMNISNKQIAQMLSVQPQTVIISRYRMRKKMNLPTEVSLDDYLRGL